MIREVRFRPRRPPGQARRGSMLGICDRGAIRLRQGSGETWPKPSAREGRRLAPPVGMPRWEIALQITRTLH